jgi:hypothetical protein
MSHLQHGDLACVDFGPPDWAQPFLSAIDDVAADVAAGRAGPEAIEALQIGDLITDLPPKRAIAMTFLAAERLARVDAALAWAALWSVPSQAALGDGLACGQQVILAIPGYNPGARMVAVPTAALACARVLDAATSALLAFTPTDAEALPGFPDACLLRLTVQPAPARPTAAGTAVAELTSALFGGLLAGTAARVASAAYAHARTRMSAGRTLAQHQAVGLRLADIAIHQQALALDLGAAFCDASASVRQAGQLHGGHIADLAFKVARDSLQVAGAHGYVAGLPFKDAFMQIRTLGTLLSSLLAALPAIAMRPALAHQREPVAAL